jgi:PLD-like domain
VTVLRDRIIVNTSAQAYLVESIPKGLEDLRGTPGVAYTEIRTIDDARKSICVSVMDFAPVGLFGRQSAGTTLGSESAIPYDTPVWWSSLFDALLSAVLTRKVYVRLLVSKWAHTSGLIAPFLVALQKAADAGRADRYMTAGQLEIKQFIIPGWDSTSGF